jgi:hypothetical protein
MPSTVTKTLIYKLITVAVLVGAVVAIQKFALRSSNAQSSYCDFDVYEYCFAQNHPVDPNTCECNLSACLSPVATDCTEVGNYLDASTCTCVSNPAYIGICDNDPYALGCPRSFDTVFGNLLRTGGSPYTGGGDGDVCSFSAYTWCANNGGSWYSPGCACSFYPSSNPSNACASAGGTWVNNGNSAGGGVCYNPSGYGAESNCASSSASLYTCISSSGRWNPYTCTCTH